MSTIKRHVLFWIAYFGYCCITDLIVDPDATVITELIFFVTQNLYLFYAFLFFLKTFNTQHNDKIIKSFGTLLAIVVIFLAVRYATRYYLLARYFNTEYGVLPLKEWSIGGLIWMTNYFIFATAYFYFDRSIARQKNINKIREDAFQADKRNLELENALLRSQINPHFLYNALNFIYAKSLPLSDALSEAILKLSDIMRYSLKTYDQGGLIPLREELMQIKNIIELAQLRFSNKLQLEMVVNDDYNKGRIPPLVLVTLVENVFKHGNLSEPAFPARLNLSVTRGGQLKFNTWNKKRIGPIEASHSIGLSNTLRRIKDAFKEQCNIIINDEPEAFQIEVQVFFDSKISPQ